MKQMTGREHCNIERTIVAVLDGSVPPPFISCVRAMVEFMHKAQDPVHTDSSLVSMTSSLQEFHATKHEGDPKAL
jgi:hypothetical protein